MLLENWKNEQDLEMKAIRAGWGQGIYEAGQKNENVVVLNADLPGSLVLGKFEEHFPNRYLQVGVAEQNMAGIANGLAHVGKIPFVTTFAAFSPGVNFSQIRLAAMSHVPYKVIASHYGLNVGEDGASAQMNCDMAIMRGLPESTVINPADFNQAIQAVHAITGRPGLDYLRVTRAKFPVFIDPDSPFEIGKAQKFLDGSDLTIIATGSMVYESLMVAQELEKTGTSVDFLNIHTVKPLDKEAVIESAKKTGKVIVIEEHNIYGGLGDEVASCLSENHPTKLLKVGIEDTYGESGSHRELWEKYGLDRGSILKKVGKFI